MERFFQLLSSANPQERQLAVELCTELVFEPGEEFFSGLADLLRTVRSEAKVTILELMEMYEEGQDTACSSVALELIGAQDDAVRYAAFRYIKTTYLRPSVTTMLETLADPVEEIRQIATEFLQEVVLCDNASFEVAGHLRHDNPQIRSMARELLLSNGQEDLIKKMNE